MLHDDFAIEAEGWQVERVRDQLRTDRYFHGIYYPKAFQIDGRRYVHGLAALARRAGARIFEDTPVVSIDASGVRKRIVTPTARLRASHIVLAGNVHLGTPLQRLSDTVLPVWRYAGVSVPLGGRLSAAIAFRGSVRDGDGIDHFRVVDGDRLMWASPETTWPMRPRRFAGAIARRIRTIFPQLGDVEIEEAFGGVTGETVHGMPQIGQLQKGLWVASGFGRQGLTTSAMAGHLIARGILWGDERWRLFSPFELVWAGGPIGRVAGQIVGFWGRGSSAAAGALARYRERVRAKEKIREARLAEDNRQAGVRQAAMRPAMHGRPASERAASDRPPSARQPRPGRPPGRSRPVRPAPPPPVSSAKPSATLSRWTRFPALCRRWNRRTTRSRTQRQRSRRKVRNFPCRRCNFDGRAPYFGGNSPEIVPHGDRHDRPPHPALLCRQPARPCLLPMAAPVAGQCRREIRGREDGRRMARPAHGAAI